MKWKRFNLKELVAFSALLVFFTGFFSAIVTLRYVRLKCSADRSYRYERDLSIVGSKFSSGEPTFPEELIIGPPFPRQVTTEKNQAIMIRWPKGIDLDPKPIGCPADRAASVLGLKETLARRPPQCILLGFGKCGTSALLEFLDLHSKIVSLDFEPDYFCERMYPKYDLQWYVKRMPPSFSDQITIEKSPCYIVEHDSHLRMHAMNSSLRVMVIVRDPITRLLSEYGHYYETETYWGRSTVTFNIRIYNDKTQSFREEVLQKVANYNPHFEHLLKVFPRNQLLIVDGDKLVTDPLSQTRAVEDFLGLQHEITEQDIYFDPEKGFYCMKLRNSNKTKCLGKSKGRKHVELDPEMKRKLVDYFRPYNEKFFNLVGQRFNWMQ